LRSKRRIYWLQLNTTNLLLQTLAFVDTVYLVACLFIQTAKTLVDATDWLPAVFVAYVPRLEPYIWPAASCAQTATVWAVLLLTVDRYVAVCYPFDARLRSLRRARGPRKDFVVTHVPASATLLVMKTYSTSERRVTRDVEKGDVRRPVFDEPESLLSLFLCCRSCTTHRSLQSVRLTRKQSDVERSGRAGGPGRRTCSVRPTTTSTRPYVMSCFVPLDRCSCCSCSTQGSFWPLTNSDDIVTGSTVPAPSLTTTTRRSRSRRLRSAPWPRWTTTAPGSGRRRPCDDATAKERTSPWCWSSSSSCSSSANFLILFCASPHHWYRPTLTADSHTFILRLFVVFYFMRLYFILSSETVSGAYYDRSCRDVDDWLVGRSPSKLWLNGASEAYGYYWTLIGNPVPETRWHLFKPMSWLLTCDLSPLFWDPLEWVKVDSSNLVCQITYYILGAMQLTPGSTRLRISDHGVMCIWRRFELCVVQLLMFSVDEASKVPGLCRGMTM